jgi:hypothetical protein
MVLSRWLLVLSVLWLAACSALAPRYAGEDTGYRLILHQALTVPAEKTRVFLQGGKVLSGYGFDSYAVSCNLEVRKLEDHPRRIEPDTFVVYRIQQFFEEVAMGNWKATRVAGLGLAGAAVDAGPSDIFRGYHFWLHSDRQPDVMRLTCRGVFAAPWEAYPPTYQEIVETLGKVASLKPVNETIEPGR